MIVDKHTPCHPIPWLFDSREFEHHEQAKALCKTCHMFNECTKELAAELAKDRPFGGGPEGTWAGQLMGGPSKGSEKRARLARKAS